MDRDVIIVGGGPAGMSAAYALRKSGLTVTVIERLQGEYFSRYHRVCGAGVSRESIEPLDYRAEEVLNDIHTLRITWPQGHSVNIKVDGCIIDRPRMLSRIRKECEEDGVIFVKGAVDHILMSPDLTTVMLHGRKVMRAKYIIGADGAYSVVRETCFGTRPQKMIKVEEYHSGNGTEEGVMQFFQAQRYGNFYQWYFPYYGGRTSGSVCGYADPEPDYKSRTRTIPIGAVGKIVNRNVMLVGDAAGLANPMTFGGLKTAFLSGRKAAEAIIAGRPEDYERWWKKSRMSDPRFMKAYEKFSVMSDNELNEFSRFFVHKGLWPNGIHSALRHPGNAWLYIGCLQALRWGW